MRGGGLEIQQKTDNTIGGFRGAKGAMPPKMPKSPFCLVYVCTSAVKLIKFIHSVCIFRGFSCS